jgi:hypothetical protein
MLENLNSLFKFLNSENLDEILSGLFTRTVLILFNLKPKEIKEFIFRNI